MTAKSTGYPVDHFSTDINVVANHSNGNSEINKNGNLGNLYHLEESPSVLRRSLTMNYEREWKSSTMPHDYNRSEFNEFIIFTNYFIAKFHDFLSKHLKNNELQQSPD